MTTMVTWRELAEMNSPSFQEDGPACSIFYVRYSDPAESQIGRPKVHHAPAFMADAVIEGLAKKRRGWTPVEPPVRYKVLALDPGGSVFKSNENRTATFGVGRFAYPVEIYLCHVDDMFLVLDTARKGLRLGSRRNYGGVDVVRFASMLDTLTLLPRSDVPDILDWLSSMRAESLSLVANEQEAILAGTDHVHFARRKTIGEA